MWLETERFPRTQPPGKGIFISLNVGKRAPIIRIEARILFTKSSGMCPFLRLLASIFSVLFLDSVLTPRAFMIFIIDFMSAMSGTFSNITCPFVRRDAQIIGSAAFFEPLIWISPTNLWPPSIRNFCISFF